MNTKTEKLQKLPETVMNLKGTGIPNLTAKLIERVEKKAIYLRDDGVYEVFKIKVKEAGTVPSGKSYPRREVYPGNKDFGVIAWCYDGKQEDGYNNAKKKYDEI